MDDEIEEDAPVGWMGSPEYKRFVSAASKATAGMGGQVGLISYLAYRIAKLEARVFELEERIAFYEERNG